MISQIKVSAGHEYCRICFQEGVLIKPCGCTGSIAFVHSECLKEWLLKDFQGPLQALQTFKCQICKFPYKINYLFHKTYKCAFHNLENNLFSFFMLLLGMAIGLLIILITAFIIWEINSDGMFIAGDHSLTKTAVPGIAVAIVVGCVLFLYALFNFVNQFMVYQEFWITEIGSNDY